MLFGYRDGHFTPTRPTPSHSQSLQNAFGIFGVRKGKTLIIKMFSF